jgi:hypothetical protein
LWGNEVDFDQISFAAASGELPWEAQTDDFFDEVYADTL